MRFLCDQNVPGPIVEELVARGCDVVWVHTVAPGIGDDEVLALAASERRVLITFDKDFGDLVRSDRLPQECGVILVRLGMPGLAETGTRLARLVLSRDDWTGHFSVIEPGRIRRRKLEPP